MNFNEYQPLALRTAKMFPSQRENMRHAILGLITEVGEFATGIKRHVVYGKALDSEITVDGKTTTIRLNMIEEAGDAMWYVPLLMFSLGADRLPEMNDQLLQDVPTDPGDACAFLGAMVGGLAVWYVAPDTFGEPRDTEVLLDLASAIVHTFDHVFAPLLGTTGDEMRAQNIAKLRLRFPDKYTDEAAEARADKADLS